MSHEGPAVSFVIPLYKSEECIAELVHTIENLEVPGGHEIILVNDGSPDNTDAVCLRLLETAKVPIRYVAHARNFGEHNAVLTGWRHAHGTHIINLDDDGQNPPAEGLRMLAEAKARNLDVVYGCYSDKRHSPWRNLGSWFTNRVTDMALDKPRSMYLSSFRCVSRFVAQQAASHAGPYPYIDGLLLQVTQRVGSLIVDHKDRSSGSSGYTFRRLVRLWMSAWINFSVLPLRIATLLGLVLASFGLLGLAIVIWMWLSDIGPFFGWGSLMAALLIFSGCQLVMLGLIGEYIGRMFITLNQRPQSVVRQVLDAKPQR